ncbi:MAG: hypothetical protein J6Q39_00480 [Bacteroidales bacterium]|nr:hypothetical protein [Bacteroidales bacterium]
MVNNHANHNDGGLQMTDQAWVQMQQIINNRTSERANLMMKHLLEKVEMMNINHSGLAVVPVKDIYTELIEMQAGLAKDLVEDLS